MYYLSNISYDRYLDRAVKGNTLNKRKLDMLHIIIPPFEEQKRIAYVLSKIQNAIKIQDRIINSLQELKKSMMHKLFIEGIGHTEFKDTEIGRIPKDWTIILAENLCKKITDGTHDTPKPAKDGFYLITSEHIKEGKIEFSEAYFISEKDFIEINKRSRVDVGDVLFSMIGTLGATAIITKDMPSFAIKNVGLFKTNGDFALANWLYYYFQSSIAKRYINDTLKGTTQKYIPLYALRKFPIILPPSVEQQKISEILSTIDNKISIEENRKKYFEALFKTMLNKLMTGQIRVKNLEMRE